MCLCPSSCPVLTLRLVTLHPHAHMHTQCSIPPHMHSASFPHTYVLPACSAACLPAPICLRALQRAHPHAYACMRCSVAACTHMSACFATCPPARICLHALQRACPLPTRICLHASLHAMHVHTYACMLCSVPARTHTPACNAACPSACVCLHAVQRGRPHAHVCMLCNVPTCTHMPACSAMCLPAARTHMSACSATCPPARICLHALQRAHPHAYACMQCNVPNRTHMPACAAACPRAEAGGGGAEGEAVAQLCGRQVLVRAWGVCRGGAEAGDGGEGHGHGEQPGRGGAAVAGPGIPGRGEGG